MRTKAGDNKIMLIVLILLFTGLYVSLIFNKNIWTDEAFTMQLVRENNFRGIIKETANDVHPPLYYLIVKLFVLVFGDRFYIYKMVSVIPMVLTMLLACVYIRPWWGTRTAVMYTILLNALPCVMEYGIQIRMYAWALFFVTWAGLSAYGLCKKNQRKYCVQLAAASICGCYTHTYAMLSCVCIYLLVCSVALCATRKEIKWSMFKGCVLSGCVVAVSYVPWLFVLLRQMTNRIDNYWIEPVTGQVICSYPEYLFESRLPGSTLLYMLLCIVAVFVCVRSCLKQDNGRQNGMAALMMLAVLVMTAGIGIVVSVVVTPFFIARYLVPCMGLLALFLAIAFVPVIDEKKGYAQIMLGIFGMLMILNSYQKNYELEYRSTHTDELLAYMEEHLGPEDLIAYNFEGYGFIYNIYFENRVCFLNDVDFAGEYGSIWYFDSCETPWLDTQVLEQNGLEKEFVMTTGIEQNEFQLYRISRSSEKEEE